MLWWRLRGLISGQNHVLPDVRGASPTSHKALAEPMTKPLPPPTVTRFYGSVDYALDVLKNRQIAFVPVALLNDPFDPYCFFETDFGDSYPELIKYVKQKHPNDLNWFRAKVTPLSWSNTVRAVKVFLQSLRNSAFVLSTSAADGASEPKQNLYMWGHYAQGHRGIAIEFGAQDLADAVLDQNEVESNPPPEETNVWAKVEYTDRVLPISAEHIFEYIKQERDFEIHKITTRKLTALHAYYGRVSIVKSTVWEREAEWRLMWRNTDNSGAVYKCPIRASAIRAVYLGLSLPEAQSKEIMAAAKMSFPDATVFRARKRPGDLALDFDPLT
jgi:hypothetical protein